MPDHLEPSKGFRKGELNISAYGSNGKSQFLEAVTMNEREELIDCAIERYMDGLTSEERESLLKDFLSDEWHSAPFERQERFIEATRARDLWEAEQDANLSLRDEDWN